MSSLGHKFSILLAKSKPSFNSLHEAEIHYFRWLTSAQMEMNSLFRKYPEFDLNHSLESIKELELLYFDLLERGKFKEHGFWGLKRERMEELMSVYCNDVLVKHFDYEWRVDNLLWYEDKYQLSIVSSNGGLKIAASWIQHHHKRKDNKRKQALYREYKKYSEFGSRNKKT